MSICKRCGKDIDGIHTCTPPEVYKTTGQRIVEQWLGVDEIKNWDNRPEMSKLAALFDQALETANAEVTRLTKLHQKIDKILMDVGRTSSRDMLSTVVHLARKAAREALTKKE
jgi:hypothetical protein